MRHRESRLGVRDHLTGGNTALPITCREVMQRNFDGRQQHNAQASPRMVDRAFHCPYIEFLPSHLSESVLRRELTVDEMKLVDGKIPLPTRPGLGIELNPDALSKYGVA